MDGQAVDEVVVPGKSPDAFGFSGGGVLMHEFPGGDEDGICGYDEPLDLSVDLDLGNFFRVLRFPNVQFLVPPGAEDVFAVGAERGGKNGLSVAGVSGFEFAGGGIKNADGFVAAAGNDVRTIGTVVDTGDPIGVLLDGEARGAGLGVDDANGRVGAGARDACGIECDTEEQVGRGGDRSEQFAGGGIEEFAFAEFSGRAAGGGEKRPVVIVSKAKGALGHIRNAAQERTGVDTPESHFVITAHGQLFPIRVKGERRDRDVGAVGIGWRGLIEESSEARERHFGIGRVIARAGFDPAFKQLDLFVRQRIVFLGHAVVFIRGGEQFVEMTFAGRARDDGRGTARAGFVHSFEGVEAIFAFRFFGSVAGEAFIAEDGGDVADEAGHLSLKIGESEGEKENERLLTSAATEDGENGEEGQSRLTPAATSERRRLVTSAGH